MSDYLHTITFKITVPNKSLGTPKKATNTIKSAFVAFSLAHCLYAILCKSCETSYSDSFHIFSHHCLCMNPARILTRSLFHKLVRNLWPILPRDTKHRGITRRAVLLCHMLTQNPLKLRANTFNGRT